MSVSSIPQKKSTTDIAWHDYNATSPISGKKDRPDKDVLVSVDNVSKKFCRSLRKSMAYGIADLTKNLFGIRNDSTRLRTDEFWAARDISFELKRGEVLGLIGPNGSGKTTLLRLLAGIFPPDKGEITIRGRVGALIALGAGFHPHLTGRENVFLNGAILGLHHNELVEKFNEIVEFAEIAEFIDAPVSAYSSGMKVRLGFAIAAQMDPDILLIDEILAVGDVGFRAKCFNAIDRIMKRSAVIFVSHNMAQVSRSCTKIMVMDRGKIEYEGEDVASGIESFYSQFTETGSIIAGSGRAKVHRIELESNNRKKTNLVYYRENLKIHICLTVDKNVLHPNIVVSFFNKESQVVAQCNSFFDGCEFENSGDIFRCTLEMDSVEFNPGNYSIELTVTADKLGEVLFKHLNILSFRVAGPFCGFAPIIVPGQWSIDREAKNKESGERK